MPDRCSLEHLRVPGLTFKILFVFTKSIAVQRLRSFFSRLAWLLRRFCLVKSVEVATDTAKRLLPAYCSDEHTGCVAATQLQLSNDLSF